MVNAGRRNYHYIYKTVCSVTGKYYLGMHSTDDLNDGYLGSGKVLKYSMKKHGRENHIKEILEFLPDRKSLIVREQELITEEVLKDPLCINLRYGGMGGMPGMNITEETRAKLSKAGKGRPHSPEHIENLSKALKGREISEEWAAKISEENRGRVQSEEERKMRSEVVKHKAAYNSRAVICHGVEYIDAQKAAMALNLTPKQVQNYLASAYNMDFQYKDCPKEYKEKVGRGSIPIVIDGIEYVNKVVAAEKLGMSVKMVHSRCVSDKYPTWQILN